MAQFVNGYIKDLSAVKDNVKLRVRVLRAWMQPVYGKPHVINMELILADEQAITNFCFKQNKRIQGQIRMKQVDTFKHQIEEGKAVTISRYVLGEIQPRYRMVKNGLRLSFLANTIVEKCNDFTGSMHCFDFRPFKTITNLQVEEDGQFDVIGRVIACDDLDCYDKNGKAGKKKPITLIDAENIEMRCTLWGAFAQQFSDFLQKCDDHSNIIAVLNLAMMKMWDSKMGVQNGYNATRLFLFNGKDEITASEFKDVEEFRQGMLATKVDEMSENTANRISTASRNSTKEDFTTSATMRHIVELLDVPQGNPSVIVGTVCAINEEEGWWYLGCGKCKKKVVKASDIVDVESETPGKQVGGPTEWYCTKCLVVVQSLKSVFRLQVRVQDATGTCSLSLFNDEVQAIADRSAYQLCDKYGKTDSEFVPPEITKIVGTKFAFKVFMDKFNATKLLPVFNVLRMSADPAIIESLHAAENTSQAGGQRSYKWLCTSCLTICKFCSSSNVTIVTYATKILELESQTDDNTTPTNADKSDGISGLTVIPMAYTSTRHLHNTHSLTNLHNMEVDKPPERLDESQENTNGVRYTMALHKWIPEPTQCLNCS
ncbi:replication protein A 70 kDa DNA-binding subunit B [Artemisia annua]|uniref:Replication protein A 70 kDa DNA-binding subunit B n=1 Tax=Artemisia annua TaxID=35608 RepID=A0A2U1MCN7_ARTAN|nr:replication protein A 70 kDa DNA-binding subunit B [Artemisia annua]